MARTKQSNPSKRKLNNPEMFDKCREMAETCPEMLFLLESHHQVMKKSIKRKQRIEQLETVNNEKQQIIETLEKRIHALEASNSARSTDIEMTRDVLEQTKSDLDEAIQTAVMSQNKIEELENMVVQMKEFCDQLIIESDQKLFAQLTNELSQEEISPSISVETSEENPRRSKRLRSCSSKLQEFVVY